MKRIFCLVSLSAIALFWNSVRADDDGQSFAYVDAEEEELRNGECALNVQICRSKLEYNTNMTEVLALCNAKPLPTTNSKCLMDCQMRQYNWMNDNGFQKDKYLDYIKESELGHDQTYVDAAVKAADLCKDKKDPNDKCETAHLILNCLQQEGDKLQKINLGFGLFYVNPFFYVFE